MRHQKTHITLFCNAAHKLISLNGKDRLFLDFLCERMDERNRITIDQELFETFNAFVEHITSSKKPFTKGQFKASIRKLLEDDLIFRKRRGLYVVSPKHFTKTTLKKNRETFNDFQLYLEAATKDKTLLSVPREN